MGMFEVGSNDGYYQLGLATARVIREALGTSGTRSTSTQQSLQGAGDFAEGDMTGGLSLFE